MRLFKNFFIYSCAALSATASLIYIKKYIDECSKTSNASPASLIKRKYTDLKRKITKFKTFDSDEQLHQIAEKLQNKSVSVDDYLDYEGQRVAKLDLKGSLITLYDTLAQAAKDVKCSPKIIADVLDKPTNFAAGYRQELRLR